MQEDKKFDIIKTLEEWRWNQKIEEYRFETSFYSFKENIDKCFTDEVFKIEDETLAEKILLTHYLLYICDRQMDYRHIFKAGGYVVSYLVEEYIKLRNERANNSKNIEKSDLQKLFKICRKYKEKDKDGKVLYSYFLCAPIENNNDGIYEYFEKRGRIINFNSLNEVVKNNPNEKIYKLFNIEEEKEDKNEYALFSSRNMLQDIGCMYKTLSYLNNKFEPKGSEDKIKRIIDENNYEGSFITFLETHKHHICVYNPISNEDNMENSLARALFELTYQCIPKIKLNNKEEIVEDINGNLIIRFSKRTKNCSFENNRHSLKRMWCIIRDFLKHPVFRECFKLIINNKKYNELLNEYFTVELPGDVWNNNSVFAHCFWENIENKNFKSSEFVRKRYNKCLVDNNTWNGCFPIHFDITFSFVPRMCEEDNCKICPLAQFSCDEKIKEIAKNNKTVLSQMCHQKDGQYCSFALYSTGLKHTCDKENCPLKKYFYSA